MVFHYKNRCRWYCSHRHLTTQPNFQCGTTETHSQNSQTDRSHEAIKNQLESCTFIASITISLSVNIYSVAQCSSHVITFNFYVFFDDIVILSLEMDLRNKFILNVWIYQYNENISHKNVNKSKRVEVQKSSVFDVQESPRVKVGSRHHVAFTRMIAKNKCYF